MSRTVDNFTVGRIARFLATVPAEGSVGWAAPTGALARVVLDDAGADQQQD